MKKYSWLLVAAMFFMLIAPAFAAPLFGDVPDEHWARDAVANLAAKGLVEGYPDGTFKGDRAATRYELAMVVARFLAKNDQEHATFATKADLEELRKLVMQLKDELDALGVRVTNLEENVSKLDKRVTELERITFYGEIDSWLVTQGFTNSGSRGADFHLGIGAGGPTVNSAFGLTANTNVYQQWNGYNAISGAPGMTQGTLATPYQPALTFIPNAVPAGGFAQNFAWNNTVQFDGQSHTYNQMVGYAAGANIHPFEHGVFPVADYRTGRPLTNGTGMSVKATLGINAKINDEIDAGLELAAYTALGDQTVNAYYGVSAPYLCNPFTAQVTNGFDASGNTNNPWTRMVLDNFWVKHKTSGIKLIAGSFGELNMDPILYSGAPNPNIHGPQYLNNYGFRVFGTTHFLSDMDWEVFATRLADQDPIRTAMQMAVTQPLSIASAPFTQNIGYAGADYNNWAYGMDFNWRFGGGNFKIGYLRAMNDYNSANGIGMQGTNGIYTFNSLMGGTANVGINPTCTGFQTNPFNWVNTPGYYAVQLAGGAPGVNGTVADTGWVNKSPIFTYNANGNVNRPDLTANVIDGTMGGYGPQSTTNWNAKFSYKWDPSQLRFFVEYANSTWRPNQMSAFQKTGGAGRAGLGATLAQGKLDLDLTYKSADAWYDPMTLRYPTVGGVNQAMWRFPYMSYYPNMYQLHDSDTYPNNRQGWKFKVTYRFPDEKGKVWAFYEGLQQKTNSVYDTRYYASAIAANVPNSLVMGYTPGYIDPVFTPYAMGTYYGWNAVTPSKIANWGQPLENPQGKTENWSIGVDYKFPESGLIVDANYYSQRFYRPTGLVVNGIYNLGSGNWNAGPAASANHIDLLMQGFHVGLQYPFNERFTGRIGYDYNNFSGHYDPNNIYWLYAVNTGSATFKNVDSQQSIPYLGFDYKINKNTEWGLNVQFFSTVDRIGSSLQPMRNVSAGSGTTYSNWTNTNPFSWNGIQIMTEFKVKF